MSTFDSTKEKLDRLLERIGSGKLQLPEFQRAWVWDDPHIRSLLLSIGRRFPVGAIMLLEKGGDVAFAERPLRVCLSSERRPQRKIPHSGWPATPDEAYTGAIGKFASYN